MPPQLFDVAVPGGRWPGVRPTVLAAHGITASHACWVTVADHLDLDDVVIAGHSMGGFVAAPDRIQGLVLADGGPPEGTIFPTADVSADHHLEQALGPALRRLRITYPTREACSTTRRASILRTPSAP